MNNDILDNPDIQASIQSHETRDYILRHAVDMIMSRQTWDEMDPAVRKDCVRRLVSQAYTEENLCRRLDEIGCTGYMIAWTDVDPSDVVALEAQALVKALGGLVAGNGALVMVMTHDDMF